MSCDDAYYENNDLWNDQSAVNAEKDRIEYTAALIPKEADTLLDVGCGNGLFLNFLFEESGRNLRQLEGIDTSKEALKYVKVANRQASITVLPFEDSSFSIVTALEVIEHLSVNEFESALKEISRVSNKYILISVPYKQNLADSRVLCPACKTKFNIAHHKKSFDDTAVENLFSKYGYTNIKITYFGKVEKMFILTRLFTLWKRLFTPPLKVGSPCPVCGYHLEPTSSSSKRAKIFKLIKICAKFIRPFWPKTYLPKWIIALYVKQ